jgi:cyclopropane fatty-acyl-phospholipid synthase-like methyltransferase
LRPGPDDVILDAGCGVGGSAIFFAKTYGARVVGVNISKTQLEHARRKVRKAGLDNLVSFAERDFCDTRFPDGAFTKFFAVESIYHAESSIRVMAEAYRVLAPGGRVAVVDRFLLRDDMNAEETRLYDRFRAGQVVAELPTVSRFLQILEDAGFAKIEFIDQLHAIQRSIARTHWMCMLSYPLSFLVTAMRLLPHEFHGQTRGLMAIRQLFTRGVVTYGGFVAERA